MAENKPPAPRSLLEELRIEYEAARPSSQGSSDVPGFQEIDGQMRKAYRWLEKAVSYLDGLHPPIAHRFDLGYGAVFLEPRFERGFVGRHEQRIAGYPVLDEINISYQIATAQIPPREIEPGGLAFAEKIIEGAGLQFTSRRIEDPDGVLRKCEITLQPRIFAGISFRADYGTGIVQISLLNVDRFDRVSLQFPSRSIDETALEDLVRFILGRGDAFLRRAPLVGIRGKPAG